jgi:hypothetical protein
MHEQHEASLVLEYEEGLLPGRMRETNQDTNELLVIVASKVKIPLQGADSTEPI